MGSTGDSPVPVGDPPTGMEAAKAIKSAPRLVPNAPDLPSGESPGMSLAVRGLPGRSSNDWPGVLEISSALVVVGTAAAKMAARRAKQIPGASPVGTGGVIQSLNGGPLERARVVGEGANHGTRGRVRSPSPLNRYQ